MCVTTMVADSLDAVSRGRQEWGYPKELGTLRWTEREEERSLTWENRSIVIRGVPSRTALPPVFPYRSLQARADGPVMVGGSVRGTNRLARVQVVVPATDPLARLGGSYRGALIADGSVRLGTARPLSTGE